MPPDTLTQRKKICARFDNLQTVSFYDSYISVSAVHVGAVQDGESGIVKVTVMPGQESYAGIERNGVTSYDYGDYSLSYHIEPASPIVRALARRAEMNTEEPNPEQ